MTEYRAGESPVSGATAGYVAVVPGSGRLNLRGLRMCAEIIERDVAREGGEDAVTATEVHVWQDGEWRNVDTLRLEPGVGLVIETGPDVLRREAT